MLKVLTLLFIFLLACASMTGYLYLTDKIKSGEQKIAEGEIQLQKGQEMLARGKVKLANGKRKLSTIKTVQTGSLPLLGATIASLPVGGLVYLESKNQIAKGDKLVAQGAERIKAGEKQLATGKVELSLGKARLTLANKIRISCALAAALFFTIFIVLGFIWRQSLTKMSRSKK
ncbi:MAG: hypothetical protein SFW66_04345 [Gammaproteobacteria bacterium]|nr:hypothetical protein [Gammaproteobacteria bacterium]